MEIPKKILPIKPFRPTSRGETVSKCSRFPVPRSLVFSEWRSVEGVLYLDVKIQTKRRLATSISPRNASSSFYKGGKPRKQAQNSHGGFAAFATSTSSPPPQSRRSPRVHRIHHRFTTGLYCYCHFFLILPLSFDITATSYIGIIFLWR